MDSKLKWQIPEKRDQSLSRSRGNTIIDAASADFNVPLPENNDHKYVAVLTDEHGSADDDIANGRVKTFANPQELIQSLTKPW